MEFKIVKLRLTTVSQESSSPFSLTSINEIETSEYGKPIRFNDLRISVNSAKLNDYRPIDVVFTYPEKMYNSFKEIINNIKKNYII